ncbi:MAG TPA: hypothetical protein VGD42_16280 [Lysobacter sp.]
MLDEVQGYAVFLYPQALEVLGEAIRPYLQDGPLGPHVLCSAIDTGGALIEMTLEGRTAEGHAVGVELMIPTGMVRMIVSARSDTVFGFGPRVVDAPGVELPPQPLASGQSAAPADTPAKQITASSESRLPPEG